MRRLIFGAAFLLAAAAGLTAQAGATPAWLLYEQGKTWASQGELGKALQFYKDAILAAGVMPEAEAAIGDIYRAEGEFELAKRHYERAFNLRNALAIPAEKYDILYRWAGLYEDQERYWDMVQKLQLIVADDRWRQNSLLPVQVDQNYVDKGLDHVLALYRFDSWFATAAHSRLGWFYCRTGRYTEAIPYLLYTVILQVSEVDAYFKQKDSDASVTGLDGFFALVLRDAETRAWLESSSFVSDLYYLAVSSLEAGHPLRARAIWKVLASVEESGKYADLSRRQLVKPFREPFLEQPFKLPGKP